MGIDSKFYLLFAFFGVFPNLFRDVLSDQIQEAVYENQDLHMEPFDTSTTFRQNFCDEQRRYQDGEVEINLALEGRHLNVLLSRSENFVNINPDDSLDVEYPGLQVALMDEVARRGKFTWRNSFSFSSQKPDEVTWTAYLRWMVERYDVSVSWWYVSPDREALGISFPMGWYDGSVIIITKKEPVKFRGAFKLFGWSEPFTPGVWILLVTTLVLTTVLGMYLDPSSRGEGKLTFENVLSNIQSSLMAFTGQFRGNGSTHAAQAISLSLSFFSILMLSAYTANLASFLVIEKAVLARQVNTVGDIVASKKSMCIDFFAAPREAIEKDYPSAIFVDKGSDKNSLLGLQDNECEYAIVGLSSWNEYQKLPDVNGGCNLERIGIEFRKYEAAFATKSDAGTSCTSLVRDVINNHINQMTNDGSMQDAWEEHYNSKTNLVECVDDGLSATKDDVDILDVKNLGGIFTFHYIVMISVLLVSVASTQFKKRRQRHEESKHDDEEQTKQIQSQHKTITDMFEIINRQMNEQMTKSDGRLSNVEGHVSSLDKRLSNMEDNLSMIISLLRDKKDIQ